MAYNSTIGWLYRVLNRQATVSCPTLPVRVLQRILIIDITALYLGSCVTCDIHTHPSFDEVTRRSGEHLFPLHISSHLGWHTIVRLVGYTVLNRDSCMSYYVLPIRYFMTDFQTLPICNYHRSCNLNHLHHLQDYPVSRNLRLIRILYSFFSNL